MAIGNSLRMHLGAAPTLPLLREGMPVGLPLASEAAPPVSVAPALQEHPVSGLLNSIRPIAAPYASQATDVERLLSLATPQDLHAALLQHVGEGALPVNHYESIMQNLAGRLAARHALSAVMRHVGTPVMHAPEPVHHLASIAAAMKPPAMNPPHVPVPNPDLAY